MKKLYEVLAGKGNEVWSVSPDQKVFDAIALMADKSVGALVVLEDRSLAGIVSERDYARKVILKGKSSRDTLIGEIMTTRVVCGHPQMSVDECMAMMSEMRIRHLPVMEEDVLIGMISMGDLVKSIIDEQKLVIEQLELYIRG